MKTIQIGNQELCIKDYYCSQDGIYPDKPDGKLWLYVNLTDICNGKCPFCINTYVRDGRNVMDPSCFREILRKIKKQIYGVSLTGGEPMLFPELVNEVISIIRDECGDSVEKDIVTNGTGFSKILNTLDVEHLDSIHLSRHRINDPDNNRVFGFQTASSEEISDVISRMQDPAQLVLNCVLMSDGIGTGEKAVSFPGGIDTVEKAVSFPDGIDTVEKAGRFLNYASWLGVRNVCFIGMSRHNFFCLKNHVDPGALNLYQDRRFHMWNKLTDHDYCSCSSGSYDSDNGSIRFYYRSIGSEKAPYARQLVYTADNRLLAGFSGKEIRFD